MGLAPLLRGRRCGGQDLSSPPRCREGLGCSGTCGGSGGRGNGGCGAAVPEPNPGMPGADGNNPES